MRRFSLAVRPFPADQCCVRLRRADLREHPTGPESATRSSHRRRPPQYAIVSSADPLITDIWRTGSGQSKRFGEPLAVADGDGIRRHPARTANTKAPAAAASARVPAWPPPIDSYRGEPAPAPPGLPRLARRWRWRSSLARTASATSLCAILTGTTVRVCDLASG